MPYVVEVTAGKFTSFPVAVYVRAVQKSSCWRLPAKRAANTRLRICTSSTRKRFDRPGADTAEFSRGLQLPPGEFDLYIAMTETPARNSKTPPKRVVHTQSLTVPDLSTGLTTSSIILAKSIEDAPPQLTPQQQLEEPFTIGGNKITPTFTPTFAKSGELLFVFFVYNQGAAASGKPEVDVNYLVLSSRRREAFQQGRHDDVQRDHAAGGVQLELPGISSLSARESRSPALHRATTSLKSASLTRRTVRRSSATCRLPSRRD